MIHRAKDLTPDQRMLVEGLLGSSISEDEAISIRALGHDTVPAWLQDSWDSAKRSAVDVLSMDEMDAEIAAARRERRGRRPPAEPTLADDEAIGEGGAPGERKKIDVRALKLEVNPGKTILISH